MKLLHYLLEIPFAVIAIWGIYNAQVAEDKLVLSLWPLDSEVHVNTKLLLFGFLLFGYLWGKINSWFGSAPMRRELKQQRKANKALNKEQEKLNETVSGLKQNIAGLEQQAKASADAQKAAADGQKAEKAKQRWLFLKNMFSRKGNK
ncbi:MAG: hypothetical protein ACI4OE_06205 [Alphaproteobacteria bacterium]|nr:hypothetical protein [Alphaproteobacteria bacterium]